MDRRLELHDILEITLGTSDVYFQPPASTTLTYPCIVYKRSDIKSQFGSNIRYFQNTVYTVTLIYKDPDSALVQALANLQFSKLDRIFTDNNLYHAVYTVHY